MKPFRLGLTGSIGMGKSTTAAMFADEGIPVWDADSAVHRLYAPGGAAVAPVAWLCSAAQEGGGISRAALKRWIADDPGALPQIEAVVHPLVAADRAQFIADSPADLVVLDIPLLFETGAEAQLDATLVVTAPPALQRARVLARPGMTEELFRTLLAKQMPDGEKRARATHVIETLSIASVRACVKALIAYIRGEKMREIVLDTETTGFEPAEGHRIVEIGAVELMNHVPTGRTYHQYINPERPMPKEAFEVHGLGDDFLRDKPVFQAVGAAFLAFIADARLVIHNASFDMKFLNAELGWAGLPLIPPDRALDTLLIARKRFPGSPASLDALCRRFGVDNSSREKHGALLDSEILAEVYLELIGGRQPDLVLAPEARARSAREVATEWRPRPRPAPLPPRLTEAEAEAHAAFVAAMGDAAIWLKRA